MCELKDNKAHVIMLCTEDSEDCVYYLHDEDKEGCRFREDFECCSTVANVNRMTVDAKFLTGLEFNGAEA